MIDKSKVIVQLSLEQYEDLAKRVEAMEPIIEHLLDLTEGKNEFIMTPSMGPEPRGMKVRHFTNTEHKQKILEEIYYRLINAKLVK